MTDPRAHRVLAGVSRVAVLEVLRRAGRPMPVPEIAERVGLHPNTVRTHLDLLVEHGHAHAEVEHRNGPGRPRLVYSATGRPVEDDTRNYRLLAQILAGHLAVSSPRPAATAVAAGRAFGRSLAGSRPAPGGAGTDTRTDAGRTDTGRTDTGSDTGTDPVARLVDLLTAIGFEPERDPDGEHIRLHHCPFREMAEENRDLVCGVHLGLMQGALGELGAPVSATRLLPFVEPDLCVAVLGTDEA